MTDDFFDKPEASEKPKEETPEKVKVGDKEFSQEELGKLVNLGSKASEWEEKGGAKFDDLKTKFGKRGERIGKMKKQIEEFERAQIKEIAKKPQDKLSPEEVAIKVKEEAKKFGLLTNEEAEKIATETFNRLRSGERILARVKSILRTAKKEGKPATTPEKMLTFMANPDNPKDPSKAYRIMFEKELDEWKEKQMNKAKKGGLFTQDRSTAGSKQPKREPVTKENLNDKLRAVLEGN